MNDKLKLPVLLEATAEFDFGPVAHEEVHELVDRLMSVCSEFADENKGKGRVDFRAEPYLYGVDPV